MLVLALLGLASLVWAGRGHGRSLAVCARETYDHCALAARSVEPGTLGRVVVPADLSRFSAGDATCAALRAHPAVEFLGLAHPTEPARFVIVVRFASAGTSSVTAELPEGPYAMYLFVAPHDAVGDPTQVGVRVMVRRGQTTRTAPLTPRAGAVFPAFGGA